MAGCGCSRTIEGPSRPRYSIGHGHLQSCSLRTPSGSSGLSRATVLTGGEQVRHFPDLRALCVSVVNLPYNHLVRCLSCNYDLSNLPEHRCPECGLAFDPCDGTTFAQGRLPEPKLRRFLGVFAAIYLLWTVILTLRGFPFGNRLYAALSYALPLSVISFPFGAVLVWLHWYVRSRRSS